MIKYRLLIWVAIVALGQVCFWYIKSAGGIGWGTEQCGWWLGTSLAGSSFVASLAAFVPDNREISTFLGVLKP